MTEEWRKDFEPRAALGRSLGGARVELRPRGSSRVRARWAGVAVKAASVEVSPARERVERPGSRPRRVVVSTEK